MAVRAQHTRDLILAAAERLFAEHGVGTVSNRQISEAAGQGNNTAVGYHFGTKADLVRAVVRRHSEPIEQLRARMLAELPAEPRLGDWVGCLVRPVPEYLGTLGKPTWYARFGAQAMTDPALRQIIVDEALTSPQLQQIREGLDASLPTLPANVRAERGDMARHLIVHTCAEYERAVAEGVPTPSPTWHHLAANLADAITGLLLAPVTTS
ncbi:TetR family transcriptional regulator [Kribbella sp. ALI-6-A]|uniref:TetR/AcrR family transcriptional regulator n=1 Tax=Kribbella sp. ALI-6-A TaxID=1933817 RepID=UPI00097BC669|nr:TetR family transcriptional regulator [Kribbella sp. ALI-6-A]ONI71466.1 TetR family transcriptional regulator [Kribbella sp. ALI-6-A]